ncbi:MAG: YhfC family glutamic-type intramembrane protease [Anaerolineales bacterium]
MLASMYAIGFLGMILLPIIAWIIFTRNLNLPWKLVLAGGLTFIASQILHIPLVQALGPLMAKNSLLVNAMILGLLAGIFEETSRYILFKFILKNVRSWKEGILVGLGHGGTEALILGGLAAMAFVTMLGYRSIDLSTIPSIPADQVELAKQQVAAYWAAPMYVPLLGFVERIFAMCLHIALSVMVIYALASKKAIWFWLALLWHALVDAVAVYASQKIGAVAVEGIVALFAVISIGIIFFLRPRFPQGEINPPEQQSAIAS